jgi:hypothetical protein
LVADEDEEFEEEETAAGFPLRSIIGEEEDEIDEVD